MKEARAISVCSTIRAFLDDVTGECVRCRVGLFYRPHTAALNLPKYCVPCFRAIAQPDGEMRFTRDTIREIQLLAAKTGRKQ